MNLSEDIRILREALANLPSVCRHPKLDVTDLGISEPEKFPLFVYQVAANPDRIERVLDALELATDEEEVYGRSPNTATCMCGKKELFPMTILLAADGIYHSFRSECSAKFPGIKAGYCYVSEVPKSEMKRLKEAEFGEQPPEDDDGS